VLGKEISWGRGWCFRRAAFDEVPAAVLNGAGTGRRRVTFVHCGVVKVRSQPLGRKRAGFSTATTWHYVKRSPKGKADREGEKVWYVLAGIVCPTGTGGCDARRTRGSARQRGTLHLVLLRRTTRENSMPPTGSRGAWNNDRRS
jgi:hypothetical protein